MVDESETSFQDRLADGKANNCLFKLNEPRSLFAQKCVSLLGFFEIAGSRVMLCFVTSWGVETACEALG